MSTQDLRLAILHEITSRLGDVRKIQLQKLVYFLQEAMGVPTKYSYRMHHYGPYAEAIETDTTRLKFSGYLDIQPDSQGYGFHITPIDDPRSNWGELLKPYKDSVDQVIKNFGHRQISELELAATIHYVRSLRPDAPPDELLRMVRALKPKFGENYVSKIHDELVQLGILN